MITFRKVNKWFGELHVLNDVDFMWARVSGGHMRPSGSGKARSSVHKQARPIQNGEIFVDSMPIHDPRSTCAGSGKRSVSFSSSSTSTPI
jgi:ABC-type polar amino acid transport system ATPase subunit